MQDVNTRELRAHVCFYFQTRKYAGKESCWRQGNGLLHSHKICYYFLSCCGNVMGRVEKCLCFIFESFYF